MTYRITSIFLVSLIISSFIASLLPPVAIAAPTATKSIVGTGPYRPNQEVTVEIKFDKPEIGTEHATELAVVVDASGSMNAAINNLKQKLRTFADQIVQYPGSTRVSIRKFGNGDAFFGPEVIDANNKDSFLAAINDIKGEPGDGSGYSSNLSDGMYAGRDTFTTLPNKNRYMLILTDALVNAGTCPVDGSGNRTISLPAGTAVQWVGVENGDRFRRVSNSTGTSGICKDYVNAQMSYYGRNIASWEFLNVLSIAYGTPANRTPYRPYPDYPNGDIWFNDPSQTFNDVVERARIAEIIMTDTINPTVFSGVSGFDGVYQCGTNNRLFSNDSVNVRVSGINSMTITVRILNTTASQYCVRFKATIRSTPSTDSPTGGDTDINTSSSSNQVVHYNSGGSPLDRGPIDTGNMTISVTGDLWVDGMFLTKSPSDTFQKVYLTTDDIAIRAGIRNDDPVKTGVVTAFYKNRSSSDPNVPSDIPLSITHGDFGINGRHWFSSRPGGENNSAFNGTKTFRMPAGDYTAQIHVNYNRAVPERNNNYSNNVSNFPYSVIDAPTNPRLNQVVCNAASLSWQGMSANVQGYKLEVQRAGDAAYNLDIGRRTDYTITNLIKESDYTWKLTAWTANGESPLLLSGSFQTPPCPEFTASTPSPLVINPGDTSPNVQTINIQYLPTDRLDVWSNPVGRLNVSVLRILTGQTTCTMAANATPNNASTSGLHVDIPGASTAPAFANPIQYPTSQVAFDAYADANTSTGYYTVCFGIYSPDSHISDTQVVPLTVRVEKLPWIQISQPTSVPSSMTGDVHSNGSLTIPVPATLNQYFFRNGTAGVVSAVGQISSPNKENTLSNLTAKRWLAPLYPEMVSTPAYVSLKSSVVSRQGGASMPTMSNSHSSLVNTCSQKGVNAWEITSDVAITQPINMQSNCDDSQRVFFIDGDLTVSRNITDNSQNGTLTFIIKGDLTVDASVNRMDGVYIFEGRFKDGSVYTRNGSVFDVPLIVNGSLIGLGGTNPTADKGTFSLTHSSGFERNLGIGANGNDTNAAEQIYYQPKYLVLLQELTSANVFSWTE